MRCLGYMVAKVWRWVAIAAAVVGAILAAFFAGGTRKRGDAAASVDGARADDAIKSADKQIAMLANQSAEIAAKAQKDTADIDAQRAALAAGKVTPDEVDRALIVAGILKP